MLGQNCHIYIGDTCRRSAFNANSYCTLRYSNNMKREVLVGGWEGCPLSFVNRSTRHTCTTRTEHLELPRATRLRRRAVSSEAIMRNLVQNCGRGDTCTQNEFNANNYCVL